MSNPTDVVRAYSEDIETVAMMRRPSSRIQGAAPRDTRRLVPAGLSAVVISALVMFVPSATGYERGLDHTVELVQLGGILPATIMTHAEQACKPRCQGKRCGADGCGGYCGNCSMGRLCVKGACVHTKVQLDENTWSYNACSIEGLDGHPFSLGGGVTAVCLCPDGDRFDCAMWDRNTGNKLFDLFAAVDSFEDLRFQALDLRDDGTKELLVKDCGYAYDLPEGDHGKERFQINLYRKGKRGWKEHVLMKKYYKQSNNWSAEIRISLGKIYVNFDVVWPK